MQVLEGEIDRVTDLHDARATRVLLLDGGVQRQLETANPSTFTCRRQCLRLLLHLYTSSACALLCLLASILSVCGMRRDY